MTFVLCRGKTTIRIKPSSRDYQAIEEVCIKVIECQCTVLEPQTSIYKWLFQLDDSQSLHRKWLFHQTSIFKLLFGVPGVYHCMQDNLWNSKSRHRFFLQSLTQEKMDIQSDVPLPD